MVYILNIYFEREVSRCFPAGGSESPWGDFCLPAHISTPAAPVKYRYVKLSRSLLRTKIM